MRAYKIVNKINGKAYIGVTKHSIKARWRKHKSRALYEDTISALYNAIRKYGQVNFHIVEICEAIDERELKTLESALIAEHGTLVPNGYNLTTGGYAPRHGQHIRGEQVGTSKLTEEIIAFIRNPLNAHITNRQMAEEVNRRFGRDDITAATLNSARAGGSWKHLDKAFPPIRCGWGNRSKGSKMVDREFCYG